jgi:hypothetical protein
MIKIITRADALSKGLKRYFTGQPCVRGHVAERYVTAKTCLECNRECSRKRLRDPRTRQEELERRRESSAKRRCEA